MKHIVTRSSSKRIAILSLVLGLAGASFSQAPPTPAPMTPSAAASPEAAKTAMEPVRQAIANQDYQTARQALEAIRQQDPNNPHIPLYESIINSRQQQGQTVGSQSPLRTPRAGVTPGPTPEATPTPVPTPAATPAASAPVEAEAEGIQGQAKELWENPTMRYGIIALVALAVLGIIFLVMKKRRAAREYDEPIQASAMGTSGLSGMEDYSGAGTDSGMDSLGGTPSVGLSGLSTDYSSQSPSSAYGGASTEMPGGGTAMAGAGGLAGAGGMSGYTVPTFGSDEEDEAPPPPKNIRPAPKEDDDAPVSLTDDEPEAPAPAPSPAPSPAATPTSPLADASAGSEGLGINFDAVSSVEEEKPAATPPAADFARPDDETVMLSSPPPVSSTPTPSATSSLEPGAVDLSDIFGEQEPPADNVPFSEQPTLVEPPQEDTLVEPPQEDKLVGDQVPIMGASENVPFHDQPTMLDNEDQNSETLPTFVSAPDASNPEENIEVPPKPVRSAPSEEEQTISFEELFGGQEMPTAAEPEAEPEPAPAAPKEEQYSQPTSDISIEDALAATLGAMAAESPDDQPAPATAAVPESTESLDERSERMFREQMEKARNAYNEKNWRQAVHFLSIASALHPENEEAKQMLKEARAEKRKSEESV